MKRSRNFIFLVMAGVFSLSLMSAHGVKAEFPERPITLINPQAPGGANDALARPFAAVAGKYLGKPVVVVNKPGASGMIGNIAGAQAAPKGTPAPVVEKLREVTAKVTKDPTYVEAIWALGEEVRSMDGNELAKYWDQESEEISKLLTQFAKEGLKINP